MTTFVMNSPRMRVTDPCYTVGVWCAGVLENVLPGTWLAEKYIATAAETGWGDRIKELRVFHEQFPHTAAIELTDIDVGVDSGQAGFFDDSEYPRGDTTGEYGDLNTFYGKVCAGTAGAVREWQEPMYDETDMAYFEKIYSEDMKREENPLGEEQVRKIIDTLRKTMRTRSDHDYLGIANVGFGVATASGYGDGGYSCYVGRNEQGQIVAARIVFIDDEKAEEE